MSRFEQSYAHRGFVWATTIGGWSAVALTVLGAGAGSWPTLGGALLFLVVTVGARALAFRGSSAAESTEVSLDSAIFIAATACLGVPATAIGVASIMTIDRIVRWVIRRDRVTRHGDAFRLALADSLYMGGLSGGLIVLWSRVFGVDGQNAARSEAAVWLVPALGLAFLVSHYWMQALELRLGGRSWRALVKRNSRTVLAEASLLPLAAAIVLAWEPARPASFALLGATYLLVNLGFNRLAKLAGALRLRVSELETLNRTAHVLGTSLEMPSILSALLGETARALPTASRVEVVLVTGTDVQRHVHERDVGTRVESCGERQRSIRQQREPVLDDDVRDSDHPEVRSRILVPLVLHGEPMGVLQADSEDADAFGLDELRLLDAIGGQAATAVENARLYALANVDGLTGLYCRRYLDVRLAEEIERGRRFGSSFALVLLDLDDFKQLNDTLGHLAGDRALREISAIAANQLRGVDLAARFGGEELAFLLPRTSLADAHAVAERIREAVALHCFSEAGRMVHITASLGVAGWAESGGGDVATLVRRADTALYRAKRSGKNRVEIDLQNFELTPSLAPVIRRRVS